MDTIKSNLESILKEHSVTFKTNERSLILTCPQCGKEKHYYLFKETGVGKCMKCGVVLPPHVLVGMLLDVDYAAAKRMLEVGEHPDANEPITNPLSASLLTQADVFVPKVFAIPANFYPLDSPHSLSGLEYVLGRGVDPEVAKKYGLMYCPWMKRVVVPVFEGGKCLGWQARDVTGQQELRINSPEGFDKSKTLLGYGQALQDRANHSIIVEGPFDMLKIAHLGGAMCSFGKEISRTQIDLVKRLPAKRVYLGLDPDAFDYIDRYVGDFRPDKEVWLFQPPSNRKDFGECTKKEVDEAWKNSILYVRGMLISDTIFK